MEFSEALTKLEHDAHFKQWRKNHKDFYLVHGFYEAAEAGKGERWQVGFYSPDADRIVTFVVADAVTELPPSEVYKESGAIPALNPTDVKLHLADALEKARAVLLEHYPKEKMIVKYFLILQKLEEGTCYNITFLSASFKTVNVKLAASTGTVLHHCLVELADFGQVLKGRQ